MKTVSFGYNTIRIGATNLFIVLMAIALISIAFVLGDPNEWLIFIPVAVIIIGIIRFFILNYSFPAFKGKPALVLDEEKLVSFVSDETVYWKSVAKVNVYYFNNYFLFEMVNGDIFRISTKWVEGSTSSINIYIQEFISQVEKKDKVHFQ
ncbi:hypothetical protein HDF18_07190 [Mucilaginibacter sp. X5P1]|uniref:hypothetical protein n=1 Tax=Mucilaginibacter sp. X5P1 TaxID=2723088 RepID=UPI00160B0DA8|nr:hypothetical protein [Mucilaginibacter sp. X5P1]MBB6137428.1 hypothetical protein [Mucilaginibacter sp. X5P1]